MGSAVTSNIVVLLRNKATDAWLLIGLNIVTEFIAGFLIPGKPIANVVFKCYGSVPVIIEMYPKLTQACSLDVRLTSIVLEVGSRGLSDRHRYRYGYGAGSFTHK